MLGFKAIPNIPFELESKRKLILRHGLIEVNINLIKITLLVIYKIVNLTIAKYLDNF